MVDPNHGLLHPRREVKLDSATRKRIAAHLSTNHDVSFRSATQQLPDTIIEWGKLRLEELGVTVHAHNVVVGHQDSHRGRDATFVKVRFIQIPSLLIFSPDFFWIVLGQC